MRRGTATTRVAVVVVVALITAGIVGIVLLNNAGTPAAQPPVPAVAATPSASGTPVVGPSPGALPTTGSEAPGPKDEQPHQTQPGAGLPPLETIEPLITAPLPKAANRNGGLVDGYPTAIAGPLRGSDIVSSSISTEGAVMQLSLVAASSASVEQVQQHYRDLWRALGLVERPAGDGSLTYSGGLESLSLSVEPSGTGNRYTIYGVFRTE